MIVKTINDLWSILNQELVDSKKSNKKTILFLTGGKSIQELYKSDKWLKIFNSFNKICFADERMVLESNPDSNLGNFLRITNVDSGKVQRILENDGTVIDDYSEIITHYLKSENFKCYAISGFGLDGHFWSLFTQNDLMKNDIVLQTKSTNHSYERITLGVKAFELLDANYFFASKEKLAIYNSEPKEPVKSYMNKIFTL
jgi:6-phosphogluconolactonase/glucosamine-6-phosphate isomerase/deaminase